MSEVNEKKEQKSTKRIEIIRGEEFRPYVADKFNNTDYFADVYSTAANCVKDIVSATIAFNKKKFQGNSEYDQYLNNIVAFCGERGQGKTGTLLTFRKFMIEYKNNSIETENPLNVCGECRFSALDVIDPSMFDDDSNILQVIIARMFQQFRKECEKSNKDNDSFKNQRDVMDKFQKVFGFINKMMKPNKTENSDFYDDSTDALINISDTVNLRISMHDLVKEYLKFMNPYGGEKFLVIPVDDIDVNVEYAYKMAEQLRKYLIIPNVVILMALKVEQLAGAIVNHYEKEYKSESEKAKYEFIKMAERYIEKLLPNGRKIYLPDIRIDAQSDEDNVEIIYFSSRDAQERYYDPKKKKQECDILCSGKGVQQTVLNYIYKKTTLFFVKPDSGVYPLVPETLRELTGLFAVLSHMNEIGNDFFWNSVDKDQKKNIEDNLTSFENYFFKTWVPNKLNEGNADIIRELAKTNDFEKHRYIITKIYDTLYNETYFSLKLPYQHENEHQKPLQNINVKSGIEDDVTEYSKKTMNPLLYSLGDVTDATSRLLEVINDAETTRFVCAIRILYTCCMHRLILHSDVLFDREKVKKFDNNGDYKPNPIYTFVGGDVFGRRLSETLRSEKKNEYQSRVSFKVENLTNLNLTQIEIIGLFCTMQLKGPNELNYMKVLWPRNGIAKNFYYNISYLLISFLDINFTLNKVQKVHHFERNDTDDDDDDTDDDENDTHSDTEADEENDAENDENLSIMNYLEKGQDELNINSFLDLSIFSIINYDFAYNLLLHLISRKEFSFLRKSGEDNYTKFFHPFFIHYCEYLKECSLFLKESNLSVINNCKFIEYLSKYVDNELQQKCDKYRDNEEIDNLTGRPKENEYMEVLFKTITKIYEHRHRDPVQIPRLRKTTRRYIFDLSSFPNQATKNLKRVDSLINQVEKLLSFININRGNSCPPIMNMEFGKLKDLLYALKSADQNADIQPFRETYNNIRNKIYRNITVWNKGVQ